MDGTPRTSSTTEDAGRPSGTTTAPPAAGRRAAVRADLWAALVVCAAGNVATSWIGAPVAVEVVLRVVTAVAGAVLVVRLLRQRR